MKSPSAHKLESRAVLDRKADHDSGLGNAGLGGGKEKVAASTGIGVVCVLRPDGDTLVDLERLLRRVGAVDIEISALEPPALRGAFARQRGRFDSLPEPSEAWTLTARVQAAGAARLLEALAGRSGLRILELPAAPAAQGDPAGPLDLRITVFR